MQIIFEGTIVPVTPVSIVPPPPEGARPERVQRLPRMPVFNDGIRAETAYIPASSIRGRLRHTAVALVIECLRNAGEPGMRLRDYLFNAIGGVFDRKEEDEDRTRGIDLVAMSQAREANPLVSLFGAMTVKLGGRLRTGHAIPKVPFEPEPFDRGVRMNPFSRSPELLKQFSRDEAEEFLERNRHLREGNKQEDLAQRKKRELQRLKGRDADPPTIEKLEQEIADAEERAKQEFEAAGGFVNIQQPLPGYEALPVGLEMRNRMSLLDPTAVELALFLATLDRFAQDPRIGGHASYENGLIEAKWTVYIADGGQRANIGECFVSPEEGLKLNVTHPVFEEAERIASDLASALVACDFAQPEDL